MRQPRLAWRRCRRAGLRLSRSSPGHCRRDGRRTPRPGDILTGASAGGINAIFLADAISTGRSLEPLTDLWLETADVDRLLDPTSARVALRQGGGGADRLGLLGQARRQRRTDG
jgi:hypothetical protein